MRKNVIAFPKQKQSDDMFVIHPKYSSENIYVRYMVSRPKFGFAEGDYLVFRTDFNSGEIEASSLVIARNSDGNRFLTTGSTDKEIIALVSYMMREVA